MFIQGQTDTGRYSERPIEAGRDRLSQTRQIKTMTYRNIQGQTETDRNGKIQEEKHKQTTTERQTQRYTQVDRYRQIQTETEEMYRAGSVL